MYLNNNLFQAQKSSLSSYYSDTDKCVKYFELSEKSMLFEKV